jgi:hypothetical protein
MQKFVVPQFINVENKVIGPVTVRQFLIFMAAAVLIAILYRLLLFTYFIVNGIIILAIASVFAFAKVNGAQFHLFFLNIVQTLKKPKMRVWNNRSIPIELKSTETIKKEDIVPPKKKRYRQSRLADLSLVVDTKGRYRGEDK